MKNPRKDSVCPWPLSLKTSRQLWPWVSEKDAGLGLEISLCVPWGHRALSGSQALSVMRGLVQGTSTAAQLVFKFPQNQGPAPTAAGTLSQGMLREGLAYDPLPKARGPVQTSRFPGGCQVKEGAHVEWGCAGEPEVPGQGTSGQKVSTWALVS